MNLVRYWTDCVVPIAMEIVAVEIDRGQLCVRNCNTLGISPLIELTLDPQSSLCPSRGDEVYNSGQGQQGSTAPILGDVGKESMFDLVPFAGSRRKVANGDRLARRIGKLL